MKTTIVLDERKLKAVMRLTGIRTRKAAVDYALSRAEEAARTWKLFEGALPSEAFKDAVDPGYDVLALREKEKPKRHVAR
jgi:hypothetical protein